MDEEPIRVGMTPPHPGSFILGLSVTRAAETSGVRRAAPSDLANGKAFPSPEMAFRIKKAFGVSMDTLLRMRRRGGETSSVTNREREAEGGA